MSRAAKKIRQHRDEVSNSRPVDARGLWCKTPQQDTCSVCGSPVPEAQRRSEVRNTGPRGTPQRWIFCIRCFVPTTATKRSKGESYGR
jgi:hypothetical protein